MKMRMRYLALAGAAGLLITFTASIAQDRGGRHFEGPRGHGPEAMKEFFDEQDVNGDGVLSIDEMTNAFRHRLEERFEKLDTNADGGLSPEELRAGGPPHRGPHQGAEGRQRGEWRGGEQRSDRLDEADTDGNGELSIKEIQAARPMMTEERFARLDTDNSGGLTREEMFAARGGHGPGRGGGMRIFDHLDTDDSGALSREEAEAARFGSMAEHFDEIDANGDGSITTEELLSAMMQRRAGGQGGRRGPSN